jgi:hypothetical protein
MKCVFVSYWRVNSLSGCYERFGGMKRWWGANFEMLMVSPRLLLDKLEASRSCQLSFSHPVTIPMRTSISTQRSRRRGMLRPAQSLFAVLSTTTIFILRDAVAVTCYGPTGEVYANNVQCPGSDVCCGSVEECQGNKLCKGEVLMRGQCTSQNWTAQGVSCPEICL